MKCYIFKQFHYLEGGYYFQYPRGTVLTEHEIQTIKTHIHNPEDWDMCINGEMLPLDVIEFNEFNEMFCKEIAHIGRYETFMLRYDAESFTEGKDLEIKFYNGGMQKEWIYTCPICRNSLKIEFKDSHFTDYIYRCMSCGYEEYAKRIRHNEYVPSGNEVKKICNKSIMNYWMEVK